MKCGPSAHKALNGLRREGTSVSYYTSFSTTVSPVTNLASTLYTYVAFGLNMCVNFIHVLVDEGRTII